MVANNQLLKAPPHQVERALKRLGADLRTARLRRRLTLEDVSEKIGTGVRAVREAENGKPSTTVANYAALLWLYGMIDGLSDLAAPERDLEGSALAALDERQRARSKGRLDNDF